MPGSQKKYNTGIVSYCDFVPTVYFPIVSNKEFQVYSNAKCLKRWRFMKTLVQRNNYCELRLYTSFCN